MVEKSQRYKDIKEFSRKLGDIMDEKNIQEYVRYVEDYEKKFKGYTVLNEELSEESLNPENDIIDITIETKDHTRYLATFTTLKYINKRMAKTNESGKSTEKNYFGIPGLVIVSNLTTDSICNTIDGLIEDLFLDQIFKKISE